MATIRTWQTLLLVRALLCFVAASLAWLQVGPAYGLSVRMDREKAREAAWHLAHMPHVKLAPGLTQTPDAALQKKIDTKIAAQAVHTRKPVPAVRPLTAAEMGRALGRGPYRNSYFAGSPMPWQKSFHDVNVCNGNLFKSFTDVQVAPAHGAGLVLQRTYNSNDARVGPFGVGWTHAYDIRIQEASQVTTEEGQAANASDADMVPRTDFFGHKHSYHRDADGLYSPPPYLYDETSSNYGKFLVTGPPQVMDDTEKGMDGTIKHYISVVTKADGTSGNERACDYIQDRHGNTTTLTYGQSYVQPDGSTRKLLTKVTDPSGRSLAFTWTNLGTSSQPAYRITQVQGPLDQGQVVSGVTYRVVYAYYTDPNEANAANDLYNLKSVTLDPDGLNRTTSFSYAGVSGSSGTDNGLLAGITDPLGHSVTYSYTLNYNLTMPTGSGPTTFNGPTDTGTAWVYQVSEPAGVDTTNTVRSLVWTFVPGFIFCPTGMNINIGRNPYFFYGWGNDKANNDSNYVGYNYCAYLLAYDTDNNVLWSQRETVPVNGSYSNSEHGDFYTFGPHGNVLSHWVAVEGGYSATVPSGAPVEYTTYYDASKYFQKQTVTDMNSHATTMDYFDSQDANLGNRGEVKWVQDAGYNDSTSPSYHKQFTYTYNQYGQKTSETNLNGVVTQYTYGDAWGNLTQVVQDPGTGHLNRTTTMVYDVMGRVLQSTDPAGQISTFAYNTLGQPKTVSTPAKGTAPAETITYTYDANGRTHSVADNRGTTLMAYEAGSDRVSSVTDPVTGTISYTYTLSGERATMTLPGGGTWNYHYLDPYNQTYLAPKADDPSSATLCLDSLTDDQGRKVTFTFDGAGTLYGEVNNQVFDQNASLVSRNSTSYVYDTTVYNGTHNWITQLNTSWTGPTSSKTLSENDYTYDNIGQRKTNAVTDQTGSVRTEAYAYDDLNRLSTVNYGDGQTQSYGFDPMGNRLQKTDSTAGTTNSTYDAANRLLSAGASTYTFDADGNTLTGGGRTNVWDSQNRLVSCTFNGTTSTFTYGADGLRRSSTVNGVTTYYVYDGQTLVREMQKNTQNALYNTATYLQGPRGSEYRRDDTATELDSQGRTVSKCRWYVYDGLGSVVGEIDPSGNLTSSPKYDVYGLVRSNSGTASSKMGFVGGLGHLSEANTGLIYMRARYYDPNNGRFISQDSGKHGNNWFHYASSNPINRVDADGKVDVDLFSVGVALIKAGVRDLGIAGGDFGAALTNSFKSTLQDESTVNGFILQTEYQENALMFGSAGLGKLGEGLGEIMFGLGLIYQSLLGDSGGPPDEGGEGELVPA